MTQDTTPVDPSTIVTAMPHPNAARLMPIVAANVRRHIERSGLSAAEVARRAQIGRRTLLRVTENERPDVRLGTLLAIADVLDVTVIDLLRAPDADP